MSTSNLLPCLRRVFLSQFDYTGQAASLLGRHLTARGRGLSDGGIEAVQAHTEGIYRADSRFVPSQCETALLCNDVSNWLGASLDLALHLCHVRTWWSKCVNIHVYFIGSGKWWHWFNIHLNLFETCSIHKHEKQWCQTFECVTRYESVNLLRLKRQRLFVAIVETD